MNEFTDRIRMEILPELETRLEATRKVICKSNTFTRDYKAGVKDTIQCGAVFLGTILDDMDEAEKALEEPDIPPPFGECKCCKKEFNSELISEYEIRCCPWCGTAIEG